MTLEIAFAYAVILVALVAMAREWLPADLILLTAMGVLIAGGVEGLEEALVGFAEPTLLALGALFVVASGPYASWGWPLSRSMEGPAGAGQPPAISAAVRR